MPKKKSSIGRLLRKKRTGHSTSGNVSVSENETDCINQIEVSQVPGPSVRTEFRTSAGDAISPRCLELYDTDGCEISDQAQIPLIPFCESNNGSVLDQRESVGHSACVSNSNVNVRIAGSVLVDVAAANSNGDSDVLHFRKPKVLEKESYRGRVHIGLPSHIKVNRVSLQNEENSVGDIPENIKDNISLIVPGNISNEIPESDSDVSSASSSTSSSVLGKRRSRKTKWTAPKRRTITRSGRNEENLSENLKIVTDNENQLLSDSTVDIEADDGDNNQSNIGLLPVVRINNPPMIDPSIGNLRESVEHTTCLNDYNVNDRITISKPLDMAGGSSNRGLRKPKMLKRSNLGRVRKGLRRKSEVPNVAIANAESSLGDFPEIIQGNLPSMVSENISTEILEDNSDVLSTNSSASVSLTTSRKKKKGSGWIVPKRKGNTRRFRDEENLPVNARNPTDNINQLRSEHMVDSDIDDGNFNQPRMVLLPPVGINNTPLIDPSKRIESSVWLNNPNINVGATTSRAVEHLDIQNETTVRDNVEVENDPATLSNTLINVSVNIEIPDLQILSETENEGVDAIADIVNVRNFNYPIAWRTLSDISTDISLHNCGEFDSSCLECRAKYFRDEINARGKFIRCCNNGNITLPPLGPYPQLLRDLMEGNHTDSRNFLTHIRKYNNTLSFTSVSAKTVDIPGRGPVVYRIQDIIHHYKANSIIPPGNLPPSHSQCYVISSGEALTVRMGQNTSRDLKENLLRDLDLMLRDINPFAISYKLMKEYVQEVKDRDGPDAVKDIRMWFTDKKPSRYLHRGRQNVPVTTDVAMIFNGPGGVPPMNRSFCVYPIGGGVSEFNREHPHCDALCYAIFFPNGERGWCEDNKCSILRYYSYRFSVKENDNNNNNNGDFNILFRGKRLFQQFIVDAYLAVEGNRLRYIRTHQQQLRVESYKGLSDHISNLAIAADVRPGIPVILPSTFIGSARNMQQNYQDAMAIVREYGKPDLFITFTCNPTWPEIKDNLFPGQQASDRPDIVARVFDIKKNSLISDIIKSEIFGKVSAYIYVIEFQKRGLPHMHLLLILDERNKIRNVDDINRIVSAQIPNRHVNAQLYNCVTSNMIHGPCGPFNPQSVCMVDKKCSKHFPKNFSDETRSNVNGYPEYARPDNGRHVVVGHNIIDNRFVVPYNPYLLMKYNAHINVEICSTLKSVKYLYKYVYKGHDAASISIADNNTGVMHYDEIQTFLNCRYVSAPEAMWRIFEKNLHDHSHSIIRLAVHLPNLQSVYFRDNDEVEALNRASIKDTHLTAFFKLNEQDADARELLYMEIPKHYVWIAKDSRWKKRQRGHIISRMYSVSVRDIERYYLRILLCHVRGPKSFDDLRTHNNILYDTFKGACIARNLLQDDREWDNTLTEACTFEMPKKLRQLFAFICALCSPSSPITLWEKFKIELSEDFMRISNNQNDSFDRALAHIARILAIHGQSLESMGLPLINQTLINTSNNFDPLEEDRQFQDSYRKLNTHQREFFDDVLSELDGNTSYGRYFHLDAFAGAGKSFVLNCILNKVRANGGIAIAVAWSGIAAMLLKGGSTVHSRFKLPIKLNETSICNIRPNSCEGLYIKSATIIVWDECTMTHRFGLEAVDRALRDITEIDEPFGGKIVILSGDWRQILPVVPHGNRLSTVESCIKQSHLWHYFRRYTLVRNMRTDPSEIEFSRWLLRLGNGNLTNNFRLDRDIIEIPPDNVITGDLLNDIYGENINNLSEDELLGTAILSSKNDDVLKINEIILSKLSGDVCTYESADTFECDNDEEGDTYQMDYVNSVTPAGLPPHKLNLKVGAVVMLLRNLNIIGGLCNGTRLIVRRMQTNVIDAEIAIGANKGERVFIPRIDLCPSDSSLPFEMKRRQFPLRLSFAMTINKAQGQSLKKVGILLKEPVFTHGMLYVAFSRVASKNSVRVFIEDSEKQGKLLARRNNVFTKNVVFTEILS